MESQEKMILWVGASDSDVALGFSRLDVELLLQEITEVNAEYDLPALRELYKLLAVTCDAEPLELGGEAKSLK